MVKFHEKFNQRKYYTQILDLMDSIMIITDRGEIDNSSIQKFDSLSKKAL